MAYKQSSPVDIDNLRLDGNTISTLDTNGNLSLEPNGTGAVVAPSNNLYVGNAAPSNPYNIAIEVSSAGAIGESIQNTSVGATAAATLQIIVEPATADPYTLYNVNGAATFSAGIDNSDSDQFKITTGSSPSAGTTAINITTAGVVTLPGGALDVPSGGTGATSLTDHAVLIGSGTAAITAVGPVAATGALLASNGVGSDPGFTTATYPLTTTVSEILYSSATNTVTGLATANRGVLTTGATGVPAITALATDGQLIIGSTAGAPAAASLTAGTNITITPGSNSITINATGSGDVSGPGSSTDRAIATWNGTGGTDLFNNSTITISANGEMVNTAQPAFLAYLNANDLNVTGNNTTYTLGTNTALTEVYDQNSDFNTNGTFTAPVTGKYNLTGSMEMVPSSMASASTYSLTIATSNRNYRSASQNSTSSEPFKNNKLNALADMDSADTAVLNVNATGIGADTADIAGNASLLISFFCGNLTC